MDFDENYVVEYTRKGEPVLLKELDYVIKPELEPFDNDDMRPGFPRDDVSPEGRMQFVKANNLEINRIYDYFVGLVKKIDYSDDEVEEYMGRMDMYAARSEYVRRRLSNAYRNRKRILEMGFDSVEFDADEPEGGKHWSGMVKASAEISAIFYEVNMIKAKVVQIAQELNEYLSRRDNSENEILFKTYDYMSTEYGKIFTNLKRARDYEGNAYIDA